MCDQWSDITLWWNILTPLEAQGSDKGGSKAARQQYQREYRKRQQWLIPQPAVTGDGASSLYIKDLRGWRDFKCFCWSAACFWPQFQEAMLLRNMSELMLLSQASLSGMDLWHVLFSDQKVLMHINKSTSNPPQQSELQNVMLYTWEHACHISNTITTAS